MQILGVEMEYDFFDADQLELYETEAKKVSERINEPTQYEGKGTADKLRIQCGIVDDFFNAVFGDGTAQKLFKGKANIKDHMEAFGTMSLAARESREEFDEIERKYNPDRVGRNREERRAYQKQTSRNFQNHAGGNGGKHRN